MKRPHTTLDPCLVQRVMQDVFVALCIMRLKLAVTLKEGDFLNGFAHRRNCSITSFTDKIYKNLVSFYFYLKANLKEWHLVA